MYMYKMYGEKVKVKKQQKSKNKYTCETCAKDFKRSDNLGRHVKNVHGGEKSYA